MARARYASAQLCITHDGPLKEKLNVHHEDQVPNEYISNVGAFYSNLMVYKFGTPNVVGFLEYISHICTYTAERIRSVSNQ